MTTLDPSALKKPHLLLPLIRGITKFAAAIAAIGGVAALALPIGFYGMYLYIEPELPDINSLKAPTFVMPLQILTSDGVKIAEYGNDLSIPISFEQIPKPMIQALLAAEDDSFFEHDGISIKGLGRAITETVSGDSQQTGGSTITMQVAKNFFLVPDRTFKRKLTEIFLARRIEQKLTKAEILTLYVNKIYLGQGAYGVQAAAERYYSKPLAELDYAQIAMIAGLPKAPSKYNPVRNPERSIVRRNWILSRMLELGYIDAATYQTSINQGVSINLSESFKDNRFGYLTEWVRYQLVSQLGSSINSSGWKVYLSVNYDRQLLAEQSLKKGIEAYEQRHGWHGPNRSGEGLGSLYTFSNKWPVEVLSTQTSSVEAKLKDGRVIEVPWKSVREYINPNYSRLTSSDASKVFEAGDIFYVTPNEDQTAWSFTPDPSVQAALIAINPSNGAIEAMVGGYDFNQSKFNRVTQGYRQPGSTIKPLIYTLALEKGYRPDSIVSDERISVGKWNPQNSDGRYLGKIPLRQALYLSRNTVSIRLLQSVGLSDARQYLSQFGLDKSRLPSNLTLALGTGQVLPIQMANAYAVFANGGYRVNPYLIEKIKTHDGTDLYTANPEVTCAACINEELSEAQKQGSFTGPIVPAKQATRIISERSAVDMAGILKDVIQRGTGRSAAKLGRLDIGGKTGTTNQSKDAWFAGFHPTLATVAWVGFDAPRSLGRAEYGGVAALPIWTDFMGGALKDVPYQWVAPSSDKSSKEGSDQNLSSTDFDEDNSNDARNLQEPVTLKTSYEQPPQAYFIQRPKPKVAPAPVPKNDSIERFLNSIEEPKDAPAVRPQQQPSTSTLSTPEPSQTLPPVVVRPLSRAVEPAKNQQSASEPPSSGSVTGSAAKPNSPAPAPAPNPAPAATPTPAPAKPTVLSDLIDITGER